MKSTLLQPVPIEGEHLATEVSYDSELQSGQDLGEEQRATEKVSESLCKATVSVDLRRSWTGVVTHGLWL